MKCYHIPRQSVQDWFGDVREFLAGACALHPFMDVDDVYALCTQGPMVLTIVFEDSGQAMGCFVTEMLIFPKKRIVNVVMMGGSAGFLKEGFVTGLDELEKQAQSVGAAGICALGRPGLERMATKRGWHHRVVTSAWKEFGDHEQRRRQPTDE